MTASAAGSDESPGWVERTSSTLRPTAEVHSSALPNPERHSWRYRSSGRPSIEETVRGPPLSPVNTYEFKSIGSAINVGRSAVNAFSSRASSSALLVSVLCTNSMRRRRALSPSQASLTASLARRVLSLSVAGRGREESRSHTARVSPTISGMTCCRVGGDGGRDGGSLRVKRVDGGVVGGVLLTARPFFMEACMRFGEDGGVSCEGVLWARATRVRQTTEISKEARCDWVGVVEKYRIKARPYIGTRA